MGAWPQRLTTPRRLQALAIKRQACVFGVIPQRTIRLRRRPTGGIGEPAMGSFVILKSQRQSEKSRARMMTPSIGVSRPAMMLVYKNG